jgi:hypothetical protein
MPKKHMKTWKKLCPDYWDFGLFLKALKNEKFCKLVQRLVLAFSYGSQQSRSPEEGNRS